MPCSYKNNSFLSLTNVLPYFITLKRRSTIKAIFNDTIIAESDNTIGIEGNHYFPPDSIKWEYFQKTNHTSTCPWKENAIYYTVNVNGKDNENSAWSYPEPKEAAKEIKEYVAFYPSVKVS